MTDSCIVVLLGGSGYIGSHLMIELHGQLIGSLRCQVAIIDIKSPCREAVEYAEKNAGGLPVLSYLCDIESINIYFPVLPRVPYCGIMLAALRDVSEGEKIPYEYLRRNSVLSVNSMQYLTKLGVTRLIQASSSAVYHYNRESEEPIGVYGYTKWITENFCHKLLKPEQNLLILRYMNPIGSHPDVNLFSEIGLCTKLAQMSPGETFVNRGNCVRDYVHITDLASFHTAALRSWHDTLFSTSGASTASVTLILDVGTGIRTTVEEIARSFDVVIVNSERLNHEGYDTVGKTDDVRTLLPQWWTSPKRTLKSSLEDYLQSPLVVHH